MLRKINTLISLPLCAVMLAHGVLGSYSMLTGAYVPCVSVIGYVGLALLGIHVIIAAILMIKGAVSGERFFNYPKENKLYIIRAITGILILVVIFTHLGSFGTVIDGQFVLSPFGMGKVALAWILTIAMCVHMISGVRAQFVGWGVSVSKSAVLAIYVIIGIVAVVFCLAFLSYSMGMM